MQLGDWVHEAPMAVTVCNAEGTILALNARAAQTFTKDGGASLLGRNLLDCHPEPAKSKLQSLLDDPRPNTYTIEKNGIHKLIHQLPYYENGRFAGLVELSFQIPNPLPHFIRRPPAP